MKEKSMRQTTTTRNRIDNTKTPKLTWATQDISKETIAA